MSNPTLPQCCQLDAFTLLARQMGSIESADALLVGAVAIAMHHMPKTDLQAVDQQIQKLVETVRSRVRGTQTQAVLAHLHEVLFEEEKFVGNTDDYYNANNSFLPAVLEHKKGLPITLGLIYKTVAERLGLRTWGVGLPGHFLVAVEEGAGTPMLVDPFSGGRILTPDEARDRIKQMFGPEVEFSYEMLNPASNRHWLTRILQNLLHIFGNANQYNNVAATLEMEMLLWPGEGHLQRDLALVLARIGMARPASIWLDSYLKSNPDDPQKGDLKQLLHVLSA